MHAYITWAFISQRTSQRVSDPTYTCIHAYMHTCIHAYIQACIRTHLDLHVCRAVSPKHIRMTLVSGIAPSCPVTVLNLRCVCVRACMHICTYHLC